MNSLLLALLLFLQSQSVDTTGVRSATDGKYVARIVESRLILENPSGKAHDTTDHNSKLIRVYIHAGRVIVATDKRQVLVYEINWAKKLVLKQTIDINDDIHEVVYRPPTLYVVTVKRRTAGYQMTADDVLEWKEGADLSASKKPQRDPDSQRYRRYGYRVKERLQRR
jgi:hypothetical protein